MGLHKIFPFSREQYLYLTRSTAKINVSDGPVRSGKNFVANIRFKLYLKSEPHEDPRSPIAFCGASKDTVYRIILRDLFKLVGEANYTWNSSRGQGTIYGREFYCFGFTDANDFQTLRGLTLGGAYVTEATLCHEEFFNELQARCTGIAGALIFCDTNPAAPSHWFHKLITNADLLANGDIRRFRFNIDSNLSLDPGEKASLKRRYIPGSLRYKRMIEGQWVAADGVIYTAFDYDRNTIDPLLIPQAQSIWVPFDFGIQHPTIFGKLTQHDNTLYLADMYRHHGDVDGRKSNNDYIADLRKFMSDFPFEPDAIIRDPAPIAAAFNVQLGQEFDYIHQIMANNDLLEGIDSVQLALQEGTFKVSRHPNCEPAIRGFGSYIWDKKASQRTGNDVPLKQDDDEVSMIRYGVHTVRKLAPVGSAWEMIDDEF